MIFLAKILMADDQTSRLDANKMIKMCIFMQIKIEIMHYNANRFFHLLDL